MKKLTEYQQKNLSFSDCPIISTSFNFVDKKFEIEMEDLYLAIDGGQWLGRSRVIIKDWKSFSSKLYIAKSKQWKKMSEADLDPLREICEFEYGKNLKFSGFGKNTGQWVELVFDDAELVVEAEF